jgi:hypothetical protein
MMMMIKGTLVHAPTEMYLKWQWFLNGEYIAGFRDQEPAIRYGMIKGWL